MAELLPIDKVLELLGLDDDADGKIAAQLPVVTELFEHFCKRGLAYVADVEEEMPLSGRLGLFRYPVDAVTELTVDEQTVATPYRVDKQHGIVRMDGWYCGYYGGQRARVIYAGGYQPDDVPADLATAYARCSADAAGVSYASAGTGSGGAPLKALGLGSGALTVQFDTSAGDRVTYDSSGVPALLQPYHYVLDHYRMKDFV